MFFPALATLGVALDVVTCELVEVQRSSDAGRVSEYVETYVHDGILYVAAGPDDLATVLDAVTDAADLDLRADERASLLAERDRVEANKLRRAAVKAEGLTKSAFFWRLENGRAAPGVAQGAHRRTI